MSKQVFVVLVILALSCCAAADTILDVSGTNNNSAVLLGGAAAATSFSLTSPETGVTISAPLTCNACSAVAFLTTVIGPSFNSVTDTIALATVGSGPLFSNLTLGAGTYFLIVANTTGNAGFVQWNGATSPTVVTAAGVTWNVDFSASSLASSIPGSTFTPRTNPGLFYSLQTSTTVGSVPEPASCLLVITGLLMISIRRSRIVP
jgi:hypothetical protein